LSDIEEDGVESLAQRKAAAKKRILRSLNRDQDFGVAEYEKALRELRKLPIEEQASVLTEGQSSSD
jgi:hypothetical protein